MNKNRHIFWILIIVILLSHIAVLPVFAKNEKSQQKSALKKEEKKKQQKVDENEIVGRAEEFTQDEKKGVIVLKKNVEINRQNGYMYADKVTIYRDVNTTPREVIRTVAEGNVHLKDEDIIADCDHAVFNEIDDTIELTGSVVVVQNEDRIEASYVKYNRKTGQRIGKGNPGNPVKFRVQIEAKKEEKTTKETKANESKSGSE